MSFGGWSDKAPPQGDARDKVSFGQGVFKKCDGCGEPHDEATLARCFQVCPHCGHHLRLGAAGWLSLMLDGGELAAWHGSLAPTDPLGFSDGVAYGARIAKAQRASGHLDALLCGQGKLDGLDVGFGLFLFEFMGGSMGSVVGEKVTRLFEGATERRLPVVLLQASGGARMQEGIFSLMQMAKAVAALERHRAARLPFVSVLLNPTTGGVAASFALQGDVNIAEPKALVGFAGPRVIESTIRQKLPEGFQRAEFLLDHGMIDLISPRTLMKEQIARILRHLVRPRG